MVLQLSRGSASMRFALVLLPILALHGCGGEAQVAPTTEPSPTPNRNIEGIPAPVPTPNKSSSAGAYLAPSSLIPHTPAGNGTIYESGHAPFSSSQYTIKNQWIAEKPDRFVVVYAGALANDSEQGVIIVLEDSIDHTKVLSTTSYLTPLRRGPVQITGASGDTVTVTATAGASDHFDAASKAFAE